MDMERCGAYEFYVFRVFTVQDPTPPATNDDGRR